MAPLPAAAITFLASHRPSLPWTEHIVITLLAPAPSPSRPQPHSGRSRSASHQAPILLHTCGTRGPKRPYRRKGDGVDDGRRPAESCGAKVVPGTGRAVISLRRMSLGSGYRYLMESVAAGDGGASPSSNLTRYYAESGTPPGMFLGAGLAGLDDGRGVEPGSEVSEEHLFNLLGMCADPITGKALGRQPNRAQRSLAERMAERVAAMPSDAQRRRTSAPGGPHRGRGAVPPWCASAHPVAGFDLTFSPPKSVSVAWALADPDTKEQIYRCHRRAIDVVLAYAEREVFHSRSGTHGVVQEDIDGVVATAFTHFDSRAGDPQLHDHVVVANRARSTSDGVWRTLDSRGLFKSLVALSELHQGVLSDLLTESLGWGWDGRARRHSDRPRFEVAGVPEALLAEFSQRVVGHRGAQGRPHRPASSPPGGVSRPPWRSSICGVGPPSRPGRPRSTTAWPSLSGHWRRRAERFVGSDATSWVAELADRNDLPPLACRRSGRGHPGRCRPSSRRQGGRTPGHLQPGQRLGRGAPPAARGPFRRAGRAHRGGRAHGGTCAAQPFPPRVCTRAPCHARAAAAGRWLQPLSGKGPRGLHDGATLEAEARLLEVGSPPRRADRPRGPPWPQ